jgi:hypothetical protein
MMKNLKMLSSLSSKFEILKLKLPFSLILSTILVSCVPTQDQDKVSETQKSYQQSQVSSNISSPLVTSSASSYSFEYSFGQVDSSYNQLFIDVDGTSTGYSSNVSGIGADYLLENNKILKFTGTTQSSWSWTQVGTITFSKVNGVAKWQNLAKTVLGTPASLNVVGRRATPVMASAVVTHNEPQVIPEPTASISSPAIAINSSSYSFEYSFGQVDSSYNQLFIDVDGTSTGYSSNVSGIGADYLLENNKILKFTGTTQSSWSWTQVGTITFSKVNGVAKWQNLAKTVLGTPASLNVVGRRATPVMASAVVTHNEPQVIPEPTASISSPAIAINSSSYSFEYSFGQVDSSYNQLFIDVDGTSTGYSSNVSGIGADYLLENNKILKFTGTTQSSWSWTQVGTITFSKVNGVAKWQNLAKTVLGTPASLNVVGRRATPVMASAVVTHNEPQVIPEPTASISSPAIAINSSSYSFEYSFGQVDSSYNQLFIDVDGTSTGYSSNVSGIGADYLLENNKILKFTGTTQSSWSWTQVGTITFSKVNGVAKWQNLAKTVLGTPASLNVVGRRATPVMASAVVNQGGALIPITNTPVDNTPVDNTPVDNTPVDNTPAPNLATITPTSTQEEFFNPERGFHRYIKMANMPSSAPGVVTAGFSLAIAIVEMGSFKTTALSSAFLSQYQAMFTAARNAGIKLNLTHRYHNVHDLVSDPSKEIILQHLNQLLPIMNANADVIMNIHASFIGAYGEMYYSQHRNDVAFRRQLVHGLLNGLPSYIHVSLRYPSAKKQLYNMTLPNVVPNPADAPYAKRVSHWNDCFVSSSSDVGTNYQYSTSSTPSDWRDFVGQEAKEHSLPIGGETCAVSLPFSACSNTLVQLERQAWSYMNDNYNPDVKQGWKNGGCYDEIRRNLGYRLKVNEIKLPLNMVRNSVMNLQMKIENVGYAAPVHPRPVRLVLFNSSGVSHSFDLQQDPRNWKRGIHSIQKAINIGNISAGQYNVAIHLPDQAPGLQTRSVYSIRFANSGAWDSSKGWNVIKNGSSPVVIQINN